MKQALLDLRNGIMSDYSIQRYTLGWRDIVNAIEKKYPGEPINYYTSFENKLVTNALETSTGKIKDMIDTFARELSINIQTLREK